MEGGRAVLRREEQAEPITPEGRLELHHRWVIGQSVVCWRTDPFVVIVEYTTPGDVSIGDALIAELYCSGK